MGGTLYFKFETAICTKDFHHGGFQVTVYLVATLRRGRMISYHLAYASSIPGNLLQELSGIVPVIYAHRAHGVDKCSTYLSAE